jgi:hypothetical protein
MSGSDSANHPERKHRYLLYTMSKWDVLWCVGKKTMKASFDSGSSSRRFVDHSVWPRQGAASPILGQVGLVSCRALSLSWGRLHLVALNPRTSHLWYKLSSSRHISVWILFSSSFPLRNRHLHCNCDVESFCYESGPCSCSSPQWRLVLLWSELEPYTCLCFIHIRNFRLRAYTFLLVFFDSLAGLAFLARSIKLCLVINQRLQGFESCLIRSPDHQRRVLHQLKLSYLSEDWASATSSCIRIQVNREVYVRVPL